MEQPKEEVSVDPARDERWRLANLLFRAIPHLAADYKNLIKYTGGLLTPSMTYAYTRGLHDALKLIQKGEEKNEKSV